MAVLLFCARPVGYEAGYDGLWLHRLLEAHGVRNYVIDPDGAWHLDTHLPTDMAAREIAWLLFQPHGPRIYSN
jgi:hypothetical protein